MRSSLLIAAALLSVIACHLLSTQRTFTFVLGVERIIQFSSTIAAGAIKFQIFPDDTALFPTGFLSRGFSQTFEILPPEVGVNYDFGSPTYYLQFPLYYFPVALIITFAAFRLLRTKGEQDSAGQPEKRSESIDSTD